MNVNINNLLKEKDLFRFTVIGGNGDGKSTLINRIITENNIKIKNKFNIESLEIEKTRPVQDEKSGFFNSRDCSFDMAENREHGNNIDIYHFSSMGRMFIVTISKGPEDSIKDRVSGASNADLAILTVDAYEPSLSQSKLNIFLASILQIPHLVVVINKMDKINYSQDKFDSIVKQYYKILSKLDIHDITFVPVSASNGDNISFRSKKMVWYNGNTILHILENVHKRVEMNLLDFRFPVQCVINSDLYTSGYAGQIASGTISKGEKVAVLPLGKISRVKSIKTFDGDLSESFAGQSVVLYLEDDLKVNRGNMIIREKNLPQVSNKFEAIVCWIDKSGTGISSNVQYLLRHTTQLVHASVVNILYKIDTGSLHRIKTSFLGINEIGRIELETSEALFFDTYRINRATGRFALINPVTKKTVAVGMIRGIKRRVDDIAQIKYAAPKKSPNVVWEDGTIDRISWEKRNGHKAYIVWFTGLSGSGKSTVARGVLHDLFQKGYQIILLDGDNVRHGLCGDLGFSGRDRSENIRRVGETAKLFYEQGNIVLCTFISPFLEDRQFVRSIIPENHFIEVYIDCSIDECKNRDPKGLYKKALAGEIKEFTGITSPYEMPSDPEITIRTDRLNIEESIQKIISYINKI